MAQGKQELKARIKSINSTKKITSAMELMANVKLQKQRNNMEKNKEYADILLSTVSEILVHNKGVQNKFLTEKMSNTRLTIMFCSDLGLCGGYNTNMMKLAQQVLNPLDPVILIGTHQYHWLKTRNYNIINEPTNSDNINFLDIKEYVNQAINMYNVDEISGIQVLYTEFINTVTFKPELETLLPCLAKEGEETTKAMHVETIFEPSPNEILDELIPMMLQNVVYSLWMRTKVAEQASRRLAMETATDNATDLNDKLLLAYNQARQAAITQEITEIVGGANAL